jgi:hypothetical protein
MIYLLQQLKLCLAGTRTFRFGEEDLRTYTGSTGAAVQTPLADRVISLTHFSAQLSLATKATIPTLKQCEFCQEVFRMEMWHWRLRMLNISRRWLPRARNFCCESFN